MENKAFGMQRAVNLILTDPCTGRQLWNPKNSPPHEILRQGPLELRDDLKLYGRE